MSTDAVAKTFTPVLNSASFEKIFGGTDGVSLPLDAQGLLRSVEFVAFPHSHFKIIQKTGENILQVETAEYPCKYPLFVDRRFLRETNNPRERNRCIPSSSEILKSMKNLVGASYVWGGNYAPGISELLDYYPPKTPIENPILLNTWMLKGVDCSGLLYQATGGSTPRNTSDLVYYGNSLSIAGLSVQQIQSLLRPLDMIVWKGHVIFVMDNMRTIESRKDDGVVISSLANRLNEVMIQQQRVPVNSWNDHSSLPKQFVVRRWHLEMCAPL